MFSKKMGTALALILLFVFTAVLLPTSGRRGAWEHPLGTAVLTVISPLQEGVAEAADFAASLWSTYFHLAAASRENRRLKTELAAARRALNECQETQRQNQRLKKLLGFAQDAGGEVITALVVAEDPGEWRQAIVINRGSADGVRPGMAVATPLGVVGKVINAGLHHSQVLTIIDPYSALDARVARTRARGVLEGGFQGACRLKYVLQQQDVAPGDNIITSGMDQVFPPGLAVGSVTRAEKSPRGMFQEIEVAPFVDFSRLEEVLVILSPETAFEPESP